METLKAINISLEVWGAVMSLVILVCTLLSPHARDRVHTSFVYVILVNMALLIFDALAWALKGLPGQHIRALLLAANFCVFVLTNLLLGAFASYVDHYLSARTRVSRAWVRALWALCLAGVALVMLAQFVPMYYTIDEANLYRRLPLFWLSQAVGILGMAMTAAFVWRYRAQLNLAERVAFFSYVLLPVAAMGAQLMLYGVAVLNLVSTLSILMVYLLLQANLSRAFQENEKMLNEGRIQLMYSQIQPHFLFNALTAITRLCDVDARRAKGALQDFSSYLRVNVDALTRQEPVPFSQELRHAQIYLKLEKMRFGEELHIAYQIGPTDFTLPVLTLQPLAENAVRHGLCKRPGGGSITLTTRETEGAYVVQVQDDGVGFDPASPYAGEGTHVGIKNVQIRLAAQGDSLAIVSAPGQGATATITIPKSKH